MPGSAAFFDLDRTLLAGASGQVLAASMRTLDLVPDRIPGESLMYRIFDAVGETLPAMFLARQAATLARGRHRSDFRRAGELAADALVEMVQPFAWPLFERHRAEGRRLVLATTTPFDLVEAFAGRLGFDDVVATRYRVDDSGRYGGAIDGPFVWATGKLAAVRSWAAHNDVDLGESYAYSDSIYDTPLLSAVRYPTAVNPDPRMMVMARARRWPSISLDAPPGVLKFPVVGLELQQLVLQLARPVAFPYARLRVAGAKAIPNTGGAILCANHRSYFDVAAMAVMIAGTGRPVRFLGKREVFDAPIIGPLATAMGGIRVDRATGSDEPLEAAAEALAGGELVAIMPQGTIPRGAAFFDPRLRGRWGAAKLAAASRVPVIPIGIWGTERVWPRSARLPDIWNLTDPPVVEVTVGEPVSLRYRSPDADTRRIMSAIGDLLPAAAREPHTPTDEELRRTYPPGYRGDPTAEAERRPGTD